MRLFGPKEIKYFVNRWIEQNKSLLKGKIVIDLPSGNGVTARELKNVGAEVLAYDLIPEFFHEKDITCEFADLTKNLPIASSKADYIICQEGVEHIADQIVMFREFSRILKVGGKLIITTPNYSSLKGRMSYFLGESEYFGKYMPPNEVDSLWFTNEKSDSVYYGHIFLVGIFKLRLFAELNGLRIHKIHSTRVNDTSMLIMILFYPFIFWFNWSCYRRANRKKPESKKLWLELFKLGINPKVLLDNSLFVEFIKHENAQESVAKLKQKHQAETFIT